MQYPNWFGHYAQAFFEKHLAPLAGKPDLQFLQIGAFTGDASIWLLETILTGPQSRLIDIDTWSGSDEPEHEPFDFADVERVYDERTRRFVDAYRLMKYKGTSARFFSGGTDLYDFIYIDGDHTAFGVLNDAVSAYHRLKPGGLLAFDDYLWKSGSGRLHDPGPAVDVITDLYSDRLAKLDEGLQVWFRKTA
jgi:predicted O-methyltransferase YrrM